VWWVTGACPSVRCKSHASRVPHCVTCVTSLCGQLSRHSRWAADASTVQLISALQLPPYIPSDLPVMAEAAPATSLSGDAVPVVPLVDEGHSAALPVVRGAASPLCLVSPLSTRDQGCQGYCA
jgi:hypothetical protein